MSSSDTKPPSCEPAVVFEGFAVGLHDGLSAGVRNILAGKCLDARGRNDRQPVDWLLRAWLDCRGTAGGKALTEIIAEHLAHDDRRVRASAVLFFSLAPDAPCEQPLHDAFLNHAHLFWDQANPHYPNEEEDLGIRLSRAIAVRYGDDTPRPVSDQLRKDALLPGRAGGIVAAMLDHDRPWLLEHSDRIIQNTPSSIGAYLAYNRRHGIDFTDILTRCGHHVSEEMLAYFLRGLYGREPETHQRLRELVGLE